MTLTLALLKLCKRDGQSLSDFHKETLALTPKDKADLIALFNSRPGEFTAQGVSYPITL